MSDFNENTVDTWDVTNPQVPQLLSSVTYPNASYVHSVTFPPTFSKRRNGAPELASKADRNIAPNVTGRKLQPLPMTGGC